MSLTRDLGMKPAGLPAELETRTAKSGGRYPRRMRRKARRARITPTERRHRSEYRALAAHSRSRLRFVYGEGVRLWAELIIKE